MEFFNHERGSKVEDYFNSRKVETGLSMIIVGNSNALEHIFRVLFRDPKTREALIKIFPVFKNHDPENSDCIVMEKGQCNLPDELFKNLKTFELFDRFFNHFPGTGYGDGLFFQCFPRVYKKVSCDCGLFQFTPSNRFKSGFNIKLKSLFVPESYKKNLFRDFSVKEIMEMMCFSTSKSAKLNFDKHLKRKLEKYAKCKWNSECLEKCLTKFKVKKEFNSFCIKLDWTSTQKSTHQIVQVFSFIQTCISLSDFVSNSNKSIYLHSIIASDKSNKIRTFQLTYNNWVHIYENEGFLLNKGRLYDLAFFCVYKSMFPEILFNSIEPQQEAELSVIELAYLERLSYIKPLQDLDEIIEDEWKVAEIIQEAVQIDIEHECQFCSHQKTLAVPCFICEYMEGEWTCNYCQYFNKPLAWTCSKCKKDRVTSRHYSFSCSACGKESQGINYCRYCPVLNKCKKCSVEILPFISVYCSECGEYRSGVSDCFLDGHKATCETCM